MQLAIYELPQAVIARLSEWMLAVVLINWGTALLLPPVTFDGPAWAAIRLIADEETLGACVCALGVARLGVLFLNGAYRPMYHLRAVAAFCSALLWLALTVGYTAADFIGTWIAFSPVFFVFEVINMFRAVHDAARNDLAHRRAKEARGRGDGLNSPVR